jgi:hypothetical protein
LTGGAAKAYGRASFLGEEGGVPMRPLLTALSVGLMLASPPAVAAQSPPVGARFQVNQFVVGNQGSRTSCAYYERRGQDVAADPLGNFVVVWQSEDEDGYNARILARRYNRFGVPEGDEFQVSPATSGEQKHPAVTTDAAGDVVVVWNSYLYAGSEHLSLPTAVLVAPVTMQAQTSNGECWSARYDSLIRRNEPGDFRAKPSVP